MNQNPTSDQKSTILIVDDSEDMRYLLGQILEGAEYNVIFAENGQEALTQAKLHHPNLILMDLSLPIMSGWEAIVHLRQMSEFDNTPIIAVTAHVTKQEEERARSAGATAHIGKPFDFTVLLDCIVTLLIECQKKDLSPVQSMNM